MNTSRGFISLGPILFLVIGLAVLGGAGWWATRSTGSPQQPQPPPTATPTSPVTSSEPPTHGDFGAPELVTIQGYTGTTQDPWITSDEKYLLFDTHADTPGATGGPGENRYAKKIDYKTFAYVGTIQGLAAGDSTGQGVSVPTTDTAGNIYFLTNRYYASQGISIARGTFTDGVVTNIAPAVGISFKGGFNMSASPSRDGTYMVFSDNGKASTLAIAKKNADGTFTRLANSADIMKNIADQFSVAYAPSLSNDNLELFFTAPPEKTILPQRASFSTIYVARRDSPTEPFSIADPVKTQNTGEEKTLTEGPNLSLDGKHLYYHSIENGGIIYVLSRE